MENSQQFTKSESVNAFKFSIWNLINQRTTKPEVAGTAEDYFKNMHLDSTWKSDRSRKQKPKHWNKIDIIAKSRRRLWENK